MIILNNMEKYIKSVRDKYTQDSIKYLSKEINTHNRMEATINSLRDKPKVIRHFLGPYNAFTNTQSCVMCGQIIHNYQGVIYAPNEDGSTVIQKGWIEGEHFVTSGNPTIFNSTSPPKDKYNVVLCTLTIHTNK